MAQPDEDELGCTRIGRGEQGKDDLASRDFTYAGELFAEQGDMVKAAQLQEASRRVYDNQIILPSPVAMDWLRINRWGSFNCSSIGTHRLQNINTVIR